MVCIWLLILKTQVLIRQGLMLTSITEIFWKEIYLPKIEISHFRIFIVRLSSTENKTLEVWPTLVFFLIYKPFSAFVAYIVINALNLLCSTSPSILPVPINVLETQTQQHLLNIIFLTCDLSRVRQWMILIHKQSLLTLKYSSRLLLIHVHEVKYLLFPSIIERANLYSRKKIEI